MIYTTHGAGCEHMRFKRPKPHFYQRVVRVWGLFWWPVGPLTHEHDCNYWPIEKPAVKLIAFRGATAYEWQVGRLYGGITHLRGEHWAWRPWRRFYVRWDSTQAPA